MASNSNNENDCELCDDAGINWEELSERTVQLLRNHDPSVSSLCIDWSDVRSRSNDLEDPGSVAIPCVAMDPGLCIGANTRLACLKMCGIRAQHYSFGSGWREVIRNLYKSLALNKSIRYLRIEECHFTDVSLFETLSLFFEQNRSLAQVEIKKCCVDCDIANLLALSLSRCCNKESLRSFSFADTQVTRATANLLFDSLAGHRNLVNLSFTGNKMAGYYSGERGSAGIEKLLQDPHCKLMDLDLCNANIDDEFVISLVNGLSRNSTLKTLTLASNHDIENKGWRALFSMLGGKGSAIENLFVDKNSIDDEGAITLAQTLNVNNVLKILDIGENESIGAHGLEAICTSLQTNTTLEELVVSDNSCSNDQADALGRALARNSSLRILHLGNNGLINAEGWTSFFRLLHNNSSLVGLGLEGNQIDGQAAIALERLLAHNNTLRILDLSVNFHDGDDSRLQAVANILRDPNCALRELDFDDNNIDDEGAISLAESLSNNHTLEQLSLKYNIGIGDEGLMAFSQLLCNKSSAHTIYASNHTLRDLYVGHLEIYEGRYSELVTNLQLNENENKFEVARQKILLHHFKADDIVTNTQEFLDLDLVVLPNAIAWLGRNNVGFPVLYEVLRRMPSLCNTERKATTSSGMKRKWRAIP